MSSAEAGPAIDSMLRRMAFSGRWRDYQQRVLDELDSHLQDEKLHVVAAPGSGKTVLGLELTRRLGRPAIILAPTRTIRDQWPMRLVPHFLPDPPSNGEISFDLEAPAGMTAATYQALHSIWADEQPERFARLLARLEEIGPITLVLDEAHHLRREWWNALQALADALPGARLVALTATPPYDAPLAEWKRYDALCGPFDAEIGVPELVRNGDLCPHQDHVIVSSPNAAALALLDRRRSGLADMLDGLRSDPAMLDAIEANPWIAAPEANVEAILEAPEMLSAMLVHLSASGRTLPAEPLALLGVSAGEVPAPSLLWSELLLDGLLFRFPESFPLERERRSDLKHSLDRLGLIEGGRVRLRESRSLFTLMSGNIAKIDSIARIARAEAESLGAELRMVVLSDHVRAGDLPKSTGTEFRPAKLGVVPIFEALRRAEIGGQRLAVLTGSLVILPVCAEEALRSLARRSGLADEDGLRLVPLAGCPGYARLDSQGPAEAKVVELVTALFCAGKLNILVGTQALLGEGWDAPVLNSLVLGSNAAAFMLSNQMRGRAIRLDPARPGKVANIWHLATTPELPVGLWDGWRGSFDWGEADDGQDIGSDLALLRRRFRAFEGITNSGPPRIVSGVARLGSIDDGGAEAWNRRSFEVARDRLAIAERWARSLGEASPRAHVRHIASPNYAPRILAWRDTLRWLVCSAAAGGTFAAASRLRNSATLEGLPQLAMAVALAAALATFPRLAKAGWLLLRNGSLEGSLKQAGKAVLIGLHSAECLSDADRESAWFEIAPGLDGRRDIIVHDVSRAGERMIIQALEEILGPVRNPRYLLVRASWLGPRRRTDYHAVPEAIARRKESAERFHRAWRSHVGSSRLVFTRTAGGRLLLLRARARSFAAGFQRVVDLHSAWL